MPVLSAAATDLCIPTGMAWQQLFIIQRPYVISVLLPPLFCGDVVAMLYRTVCCLPHRGHTRRTPITAAAQSAIASLHPQPNCTDRPGSTPTCRRENAGSSSEPAFSYVQFPVGGDSVRSNSHRDLGQYFVLYF